jgi:hypothetical protein
VTVYDSLHSSLHCECLLFHRDEWHTTAHTLNSFWMNYDSFITFRLPQYKSPCRTVPLLFCCHGNMFSDLLPSDDSFVVIRCSGNVFTEALPRKSSYSITTVWLNQNTCQLGIFYCKRNNAKLNKMVTEVWLSSHTELLLNELRLFYHLQAAAI